MEDLHNTLAAAILAECPHAAGPHAGRLGDVFAKLRSLNIPWVKILSLLPSIIQLLTTGTGDWTAILAAILALFGKTATA